jgi:hypothetical protein
MNDYYFGLRFTQGGENYQGALITVQSSCWLACSPPESFILLLRGILEYRDSQHTGAILADEKPVSFHCYLVEYQGTVNKKQAGKGWGVVFVCTTTSAVHIEFIDTCSTDSFLKIHVLQRDTITAPGGQGGAAGSGSQASLLVGLQGGDPMGGQKGDQVDPGAHGRAHFNGQAERMIGLIKRQIWRSFEGRKYSQEETVTILKEAAQVVNSRPLRRNPWPEGEPLCPQDLMLGRARPGQPIVNFETGLPAAWLTDQHKMQLLQEEQPRVKLLREEQP